MDSRDSRTLILLFAQEIHFQAVAALRAKDRISEIFSTDLENFPSASVAFFSWDEELRVQAEEFLSRVGNLSLLLFSRKNTLRSEVLRNELQVQHDNPLNNRKVRNALQHTDERIDDLFTVVISDEKNFDRFLLRLSGGDNGFFSMRWYGEEISVTETENIYRELLRLKRNTEEVHPILKFRNTSES